MSALNVMGRSYRAIEGVQIKIVYGLSTTCRLAGESVVVTGSVGGMYENATEILTFNKANDEATGTSLKVGTSTVEWAGEMPVEALGVHVGEALEIS